MFQEAKLTYMVSGLLKLVMEKRSKTVLSYSIVACVEQGKGKCLSLIV